VTSAKPLFEGRQRALYVGKDEGDRAIVPDEQIPRSAVEQAIGRLKKELDDIDIQDGITERIGSESFMK